MNYKEFANSIKAKYPQYKDIDDLKLSKTIVQKYPIYSNKVDFSAIQQKTEPKYNKGIVPQEPTMFPSPEDAITDPIAKSVFAKDPSTIQANIMKSSGIRPPMAFGQLGGRVSDLAQPKKEPSFTEPKQPEIPEKQLTEEDILKLPVMFPYKIEKAVSYIREQLPNLVQQEKITPGEPAKTVVENIPNVLVSTLLEFLPISPREQADYTLYGQAISGVSNYLVSRFPGLAKNITKPVLDKASDLWRRLTIRERGLSVIPDEQLYNIYKLATPEAKAKMVRLNPQAYKVVMEKSRIPTEGEPLVSEVKPTEVKPTEIKPTEIKTPEVTETEKIGKVVEIDSKTKLPIIDTSVKPTEPTVVEPPTTPVKEPEMAVKPPITPEKVVSPVKEVKPPEIGKESWQMTNIEYTKSELMKLKNKTYGEDIAKQINSFQPSYAPQHKKDIRQAISEGKTIPTEVLKDYPELQKQAKPIEIGKELKTYANNVISNGKVKQVKLVGSSVSGKIGKDTDILYDFGDLKLPKNSSEAAIIIEKQIESSNIDTELYDTFIKSGDRYFHISTGAGREVVENTSYAQKQKGKPTIILSEVKPIEAPKQPLIEEAKKYKTPEEFVRERNFNGYIPEYGTKNQYYNLTEKQELQAVVDGNKPSYLGQHKKNFVEEIKFAKDNGLITAKTKFGELAIARDKKSLDTLIKAANSGTGKELGLALGYQDMGTPLTKSQLVDIWKQAHEGKPPVIEPTAQPLIEEAKKIPQALNGFIEGVKKYDKYETFNRGLDKSIPTKNLKRLFSSNESVDNIKIIESKGQGFQLRTKDKNFTLTPFGSYDSVNKALSTYKIFKENGINSIQDIWKQAHGVKPTPTKIEKPVEKPVEKPKEIPAVTRPDYQTDIENLYAEHIKALKSIGDKSEAKRLSTELSNIKALIKSTYKGEQEIRKMKQTIMAWARVKGLTNTATRDIIKGVSGYSSITNKKITFDQLGKILGKMREARPSTIGYKTVITRETENRIQTLKEVLINRNEMTDDLYNQILKSENVKYPAYISKLRFTTETKGKDIIKNMLDTAPLARKQIQIDKALEKNPTIKSEVDKIETGFEKQYENKLAKEHTLLDMHHFSDSLEKQTGIPLGTTWETLNDKRLKLNKQIDNKIDKLAEVGGKDYKSIIQDEEALNRINDYVASKLPDYVKGKPVEPVNITASEKAVATEIIKGLKGFESDVRYNRFHEWYEHGTPIPNAPAEELAKATKILETQGDEALREWLKGRSWGVIRTGYDIGEVIKPTIITYKARPMLSKRHLNIREDIHFKKYERNIVQRYLTYVRQMTYKTELKNEIKALQRLFENNRDVFLNQGRVAESYSSNLREMLGQKEPKMWLGELVTSGWSQAARALFLDPRKGIRNLFQNPAFYTSPEDILALKQSKMSPEDIKYFETNVSQRKSIHKDLIYQTENKGIWGFWKLNEWADAFDVMGRTDEINRLAGFKLKLGAVRNAMKNNPDFMNNAEQMAKFQKDAGFNDMELMERKHALHILATEGRDEMARYVAKAVTQKVHFLYDRAQRSPEEMGSLAREIFSNLLTFKKGSAQRIILDLQKLGKPQRVIEPRVGRPIRSIIWMTVWSSLVGWVYKKLTGDKRNPYSPVNILGDISLGGLATGSQETIGELTRNAMSAATGDKEALGRVLTNIPRTAEMFVPFYDDAIHAIEGLTGYKKIDTAILRQMRMAINERIRDMNNAHPEYKGKPMSYYKTQRNLIETGQHIMFGTEPEQKKEPKSIVKSVVKPVIKPTIKPLKPLKLLKPD